MPLQHRVYVGLLLSTKSMELIWDLSNTILQTVHTWLISTLYTTYSPESGSKRWIN